MIAAGQPMKKIRLTLIRTPGNYFSGKIAGDEYINIRSIPIMEKYRVVISSFNAAEYAKFRNLFSGEVQFLSFGRDQLEDIVATANHAGYYLCSFRSTGSGNILLHAEPDKTGQNYLLNEIRNGIINGIYPSMYRLSDGKHTMELRDDFNIIIGMDRKADPGPVFDLFVRIVQNSRDMHDRIMDQLYPRNGGALGIPNLPAISLRRSPDVSDAMIHKVATRTFTAGILEDSPVGKAFYIFDQTFTNPFCRITLLKDHISLVSLPNGSMSSVLRVMSNLSDVSRVNSNGF